MCLLFLIHIDKHLKYMLHLLSNVNASQFFLNLSMLHNAEFTLVVWIHTKQLWFA